MLFLSLLILSFACQSSDNSYASAKLEQSLEQPAAPAYNGDYQAQGLSQTHEPKQELILLKTADCSLEVENLKASQDQLQAFITQHQGYVADLQIRNNNWRQEASIEIRIPIKNFDLLLDTIKGIAKSVDHQHINSRDVTEEYIDISTRLATKKAVRDRYIDILRNKAKTVEEILLAEEQIRKIQEEIEAKEGRLNYLKDRAAMSTVRVEMYENLDYEVPPEEGSWWSRFAQDIGNSLGFGAELVRGMLLSIIALWPIVLIVALLVWKRKAIFGRWRRK